MPSQRRARNTYSITMRGDKFEATYSIPDTSPRKRVSAWGVSERMAVVNLLEKLRSQSTTLPMPAPDANENRQPGHSYTVKRWANEWFDNYVEVQSETGVRYGGHLDNHIIPHLGNYTLNNLSVKVLKEKWWNVIKAKKKMRGGEITNEPLLGPSGLTNVYKTMRMMLQAAHEKIGSPMKLTPRFFPLTPVKRHENDQEIAKATKRLAKLFNEELPHDDERWALYLFSLLGLRQAVRLGLSIESIDLTPGAEKLIISQQLYWDSIESKLILKNATKNGESRSVPLWDIYLEASKRLLERRHLLGFSPEFKPEDEFRNLLMLQRDGKPLTRQTDTKDWRELTGGNIRGHVARHSTGQILAENGTSDDVAKTILGHKSDALTLYYRSVSNIFASKEMREKYELGEKANTKWNQAV